MGVGWEGRRSSLVRSDPAREGQHGYSMAIGEGWEGCGREPVGDRWQGGVAYRGNSGDNSIAWCSAAI